MRNTKIYYVIQNSAGDFFKIDNISGGYPYFIDDFEFCEKYNSREVAENFLQSDYATIMFRKEFENCSVRTVRLTLE